MPTMCSLYYQATLERKNAWFVVAALKTYDHLCFDRTVNVEDTIFEFFVPADMEDTFLAVMRYLEQQHLVSNVCKLPNRIAELGEEV